MTTGITGDDAPKERKVGPGWYQDKRWKDEERRWDGQRWLDEWRPAHPKFGERPESFLLWGLLLAVGLGLLAGFCFTLDDGFGWFVVWLGSAISGTVFTIGVIGKGVEVGVRAGRR